MTLSSSATLADGPQPRTFVRGDVNLDGRLSLADVFSILGYMHQGQGLLCHDAADVDDSGTINGTDFAFILGTLFFRHAPPPPPYPSAGVDPTDADGLGCEQSSAPPVRRGGGAG
ncbi:MAG: hypothetical protein AAF517_19840, partial [Planctomycetota bacterium]